MGFTIRGSHLKQYSGNDAHVVIPEQVRIIDDYAFSNASSLVSVTIPRSVNEIGTRVFYACENLQEVEIPDSVRFLGSGTFVRCTSLVHAKLPDGISSVPNSTFFGCTALKQVNIPHQAMRIGESAFSGCSSLEDVQLPDTVKILDKHSFQGCRALKKLVLPDGLTRIEDGALKDCVSLRELDIPSSVTWAGIDSLAVNGTIALRAPDFFVHDVMLDSRHGSLYNRRPYRLDHAFLPHVDLSFWNKEDRCMLAVCYLETYVGNIKEYDTWIMENKDECLQMIASEKRWDALRTCMNQSFVTKDDLLSVIDQIHDPVIRAEILAYGSGSSGSLLDLL